MHTVYFYFIYYDFLMDSTHNFLARDCPLILKMMASELSVNKELIRFAFITDLDKRKIYVKFCAPQFACLGCLDAYKDFMGTPVGESALLNTVITR